MINYENFEISAVVCSLNAESLIQKCLESLVESNVGEIILVDGNSSDRTVELAKKFTNKIFKDPGKGLAFARNLGIKNATKDLILNFGVDNTIDSKNLFSLKQDFLKNDYCGVASCTKLKITNYLSRSLNEYKKVRFYPGERLVIGTPNIFERSLLLDEPYRDDLTWSDDAELCKRLRIKRNCTFYVSNSYCFEIGQNSWKNITNRWMNYGKSDSEVFKDNFYSRNFFENIKSIFYPIKVEFFQPLFKLNIFYKVYLLPFLIYICFFRYLGWARSYFANEFFTK